VGQGKKFYTHSAQTEKNIMKKLTGITGQGRNANTPFEAWNYLIIDEILGNTSIFQHTNQ